MPTITELDLRGYQCPLPVLKTRHRMRAMQEGELLRVLTDDPLAGVDIPHFCNETGQVLMEQHAGEGDEQQFLLARGPGKL